MPRLPAPVTGRDEAAGHRQAAKVRWHRESPSRPHSQGIGHPEKECDDLSRTGSRPARARRRAGRIAGWLHRRRQLKSRTFLVIRDRSGLAQVVLASPDEVAAAAELAEEAVVAVTGTVAVNDQAPGGAEIIQPVITQLSGPPQPPRSTSTGRP